MEKYKYLYACLCFISIARFYPMENESPSSSTWFKFPEKYAKYQVNFLVKNFEDYLSSTKDVFAAYNEHNKAAEKAPISHNQPNPKNENCYSDALKTADENYDLFHTREALDARKTAMLRFKEAMSALIPNEDDPENKKNYFNTKEKFGNAFNAFEVVHRKLEDILFSMQEEALQYRSIEQTCSDLPKKDLKNEFFIYAFIKYYHEKLGKNIKKLLFENHAKGQGYQFLEQAYNIIENQRLKDLNIDFTVFREIIFHGHNSIYDNSRYYNLIRSLEKPKRISKHQRDVERRRAEMQEDVTNQTDNLYSVVRLSTLWDDTQNESTASRPNRRMSKHQRDVERRRAEKIDNPENTEIQERYETVDMIKKIYDEMDDAEKANFKESLKKLISEENEQFKRFKAIEQLGNFDEMRAAFIEAKNASVAFKEEVNNFNLRFKCQNNDLFWYENHLNRAIVLFNIIAEKLEMEGVRGG